MVACGGVNITTVPNFDCAPASLRDCSEHPICLTATRWHLQWHRRRPRPCRLAGSVPTSRYGICKASPPLKSSTTPCRGGNVTIRSSVQRRDAGLRPGKTRTDGPIDGRQGQCQSDRMEYDLQAHRLLQTVNTTVSGERPTSAPTRPPRSIASGTRFVATSLH